MFLTGFSLGGFIDDVRFKGTSVGITKCVDRNKQEGVPHHLIKRRCINENQKELENNVLTGSSGYRPITYEREIANIYISPRDTVPNTKYEKFCINSKDSLNQEVTKRFKNQWCRVTFWTGKSKYSGTVENKTKDKIITSFEIHVSHDDNIDSNRKKITEIIPFETWILPHLLPNRYVEVNASELKFHPRRDRISEGEGDSRKFFFSFSFQNIKGVDFILK